MTRLVLAAALVATCVTTARADGDGAAQDKSMGVAMGLSAGGTAAGLALATFALVDDGMPADLRRWTFALGGTAALVMPTAGHWYATGHFGGGTVGGYLRIGGGAVVMFTGVVYAVSEHEEDDPGDNSAAIETGIIYGGLAMIAAGMIVDIATTPSAVHRANRQAPGLRITGIAPTIGGFSVVGTF